MPDLIESVIPARHRRLGRHDIRRLLPSGERRMVGPFIYFDHIGPERLDPGQGVDVPPHPHIHLATVTSLFEGDLVHRDSLGSVEVIRPGDINWMHAGEGIVHSERSSPESRDPESTIHGIQLWVALPKDQEDTTPTFRHYPESSLPAWTSEGVEGRLLVGSAYGLQSPVETASRTLYIDLRMKQGASVPLPSQEAELCAYVVNGTVALGDREFGQSEMIVFGSTENATATAVQGTRLLILGGDPVGGKRHIWWNFVSSSKERIEEAKRDWSHNRFPLVPGDKDERLPLPE